MSKTLYHTPSGRFWHMDPQCRRVLRWQWPRLKPFERNPQHIYPWLRCQGCWKFYRIEEPE